MPSEIGMQNLEAAERNLTAAIKLSREGSPTALIQGPEDELVLQAEVAQARFLADITELLEILLGTLKQIAEEG